MKAYAITIEGNAISETATNNLILSSLAVNNDIDLTPYQAITPSLVDSVIASEGLIWNYPWVNQENDFASGLIKNPYRTADPKARVACALSHYSLWKKCFLEDIPILILEHDSVFTHKLNYDNILSTKYQIVGINDPRGATRRSGVYHKMVQDNPEAVQRVPAIDDLRVPQGLAGNSAYIIKPTGARAMIDLVKVYGLWPNDAIMCRQLFTLLGQTRKYYTRVQGTTSTTTL